MAFALSWPFLAYGFGWFSVEEEPLGRYLFACLGMGMVALAATLTRLGLERRGFADVGWRLGPCRWYLAALLFCALLWLGPALVALPFGQLAWSHDLRRDEWIVVILSLTGFSMLPAFGEEFGWRGYLLPRLLTDRQNARGILLLGGLIWGFWHCAIFFGPLLRAGLGGSANWLALAGPAFLDCLRGIGTSIVLSFVFGAVWLKSRSIFLCAFLHGSWIGLRDAAGHLFRYPDVFQLLTVATTVGAWFIADRWLGRYQREGNAP
jgi:membrane protease YdiL (CAAX protease family)